MSEVMRPIPFPELVRWAQGEYDKCGSLFGVRAEKFFRPEKYFRQEGHSCPDNLSHGEASPYGRLEMFGRALGSPIGPAAGPHSQLAQNILAAYLCGARFMELKTVQTMDGEELRKAVARPCINAVDEGYNVEWSTELTVTEAQEEYIKAWFLCHVFAREFGIAEKCDFIFNMSAGYSLEGIQSPKIDSYIEGLKNAANTEEWNRCHEYLAANIGSFKCFTKSDLDAISPLVSDNITLSTLHGCPREEIEKIASYLISGKCLHTFVKCNPTLLGYGNARRILDEMGFKYVSFDDHHFKNDLQLGDAVSMLGRLRSLAAKSKLSFGVKLTNTFPVRIEKKELPGEEMYMSGRALFPLSLNVAKKLSDAFNGELPISYSGGADFFNLKDILETGIRPVTVATTLLKPGGYERLSQLAELALDTIYGKQGQTECAVLSAAAPSAACINLNALNALVESAPNKKRYRKEYRTVGIRKSHSPLPAPRAESDIPQSALPVLDCYRAPCMDSGCPIHQRIPEYLTAMAEGNYGEAFRIIARDNTAPSITGTICDHQCQSVCTRVDYEDALQIRQAKLKAAETAQEKFTAVLAAPEYRTKKTAAIIGAGPAGIAAAIFLRRNGVQVTVYEKRDRPYGIVQYVIPAFRISDEAIFRDYQMAEKYGVNFVFNTPVSSISELRKKHDFVILATGAWKEGAAAVKQGMENVIDALKFLENSRKSACGLEPGKNIAVIGAGDVAMDCARAVKRNRGVESVTIVYRRTREFMPSEYGEQELALADGVKFMELLAPESYLNGILSCEKMRLGDYDALGRRSIIGTGEKVELRFDAVIGAVGARVDTGYFAQNDIALNEKGIPVVGRTGESSIPGVYLAGDCKTGPATVVKAIADAKAAAFDILVRLGLNADFSVDNIPLGNRALEAGGSFTVGSSAGGIELSDLYLKKGLISEAKSLRAIANGFVDAEGRRCLSCHSLCEICVDVCPNRANTAIETEGGHQIIHIDRICNECGNCATFCPHPGKPYKDKFTIFSSEEDFTDSENPGFLKLGEGGYRVRLEDKTVEEYRRGGTNIPGELIKMINIIEMQYGYLLAGCPVP